MINKVVLVGRLGGDPEIAYTASGTTTARFSLATSEAWRDKETGQKTEKVEWHKIVAFGGLAEVCEKYIEKGMLIYVEGKLQTRSWEKDGVTRYTTEIIARQIKMLGGGGERQNEEKRADDDDIPF